jgi:two-component system, response regulator, stage 0 sporulation protein F
MKKHRILVVDDIVINRMLITEIVSGLGYEYVEASNGKDALEKLQKYSFDVVLMDIEMPVMNGIETTKYIREKLKHPLKDIPVIALTAHNPEIFFKDYRDVGFTALLTKPYTIQKFTTLLNSHLLLNK